MGQDGLRIPGDIKRTRRSLRASEFPCNVAGKLVAKRDQELAFFLMLPINAAQLGYCCLSRGPTEGRTTERPPPSAGRSGMGVCPKSL